MSSVVATGAFGIGTIFIPRDQTLNTSDLTKPIYLAHQGTNTPVTIHCTNIYGVACNIEGQTVYIDAHEIPQNGSGASSGERAWTYIDPAIGYEIDLYNTQWPPVNSILTGSYGGGCYLPGNGFTNPSYSGPVYNVACKANAVGAPQSLTALRATDWAAATTDTVHGHLPYALSYVYACPGFTKSDGTNNNPLPAPFFSGGDGSCAYGTPTEGTRLVLNMHDSDVNTIVAANSTPQLTAVLLRTMDLDHYGAFMTDSTGSVAAPNITFRMESDATYSAFGHGAPLYNTIYPLAQAEGMNTFVDNPNNRVGITISLPAAITWSNFFFAVN